MPTDIEIPHTNIGGWDEKGRDIRKISNGEVKQIQQLQSARPIDSDVTICVAVHTLKVMCTMCVRFESGRIG